MGKNNNKPAMPAAAPAVNTKKQEVTVTKPGTMIPPVDYQALSPDNAVIALERISKLVHDDPRGKEMYNLTDEQYQMYNEFVLAGMTTVLMVDILAKRSKFAATMHKTQLQIVERVANDLNIHFDVKALPAPDANGNVKVEISAENVTANKEIVAAAEEEAKTAESAVELDPTKFASEDDLAVALNHIIISEKAAFLKFTRTSALLKSYRLIQAGDDAEAKKKIEERSIGDLLSEVFSVIENSKVISHMPIILNGFGKYIYRETSQAMSPVLAFVKLRDASKNSAGIPSVDNETLVGIERTLVAYCANNSIKAEEAKLADHEKNLAAVSKDKKKNAAAIKEIEDKIAACKTNIEHFNDVIAVTHEPNSQFADDFLEDYNNSESECYRRARQAFKYITQSYYGEELTKSSNQESVRKNVQQLIGLITNMFRPAANQFDQFSESRLIELIKSTEEESKN